MNNSCAAHLTIFSKGISLGKKPKEISPAVTKYEMTVDIPALVFVPQQYTRLI